MYILNPDWTQTDYFICVIHITGLSPATKNNGNLNLCGGRQSWYNHFPQLSKQTCTCYQQHCFVFTCIYIHSLIPSNTPATFKSNQVVKCCVLKSVINVSTESTWVGKWFPIKSTKGAVILLALSQLSFLAKIDHKQWYSVWALMDCKWSWPLKYPS